MAIRLRRERASPTSPVALGARVIISMLVILASSKPAYISRAIFTPRVLIDYPITGNYLNHILPLLCFYGILFFSISFGVSHLLLPA
jgi:hypothetical protein